MSLFAAILFAGAVFACSAPDGYTYRQNAYAKCLRTSSGFNIKVYQSSKMCDAFCVCYNSNIYYVSASNKDGYKYMFYDDRGDACYFNM